MKTFKYAVAGLFAILGIWLLISTWADIQNSIRGPIRIQTHIDKPTIADFRAEAPRRMLEECTNNVVGLSRIISVTVQDWDEQPSNWTGHVTAEFMNTMGGVGRTNIDYWFDPHGGIDVFKTAYQAAVATK